MKFVKTAVAVAITTGIAAAPMVASAETTLSGVVEVKYAGSDEEIPDDPLTPIDESESTENDPSMKAGDVRVGVVSEHELDSGLIGYGSIKLTLDDLLGEVGGEDSTVEIGSALEDGDSDIEVTQGTLKADDIYVGLKGGFGDIRFGEIPLAVEYGQLANDIHDVADDVGDGASYTGAFGPASIVLNYATANDNDSDMFGAGAKFTVAGATIGLGFEDRDEKANVAAGASYAIGGFTIGAQYWAQENEFDPDVAINTEADDQVQTEGFDIDDLTNVAVKLGYGIGAFSGAVTYSFLEGEQQDEGEIAPTEVEETVIRLDLAYDMGGGLVLSTRINNTADELGDADDVIDYRVQLAKTF